MGKNIITEARWLTRFIVAALGVVAYYNIETIGSFLAPIKPYVHSKVYIEKTDTDLLAANPVWMRLSTSMFRLAMVALTIGAICHASNIGEDLDRRRIKTFNDGFFYKAYPKKYGWTVWLILAVPILGTIDLLVLLGRGIYRTIEEILFFQIVAKKSQDKP